MANFQSLQTGYLVSKKPLSFETSKNLKKCNETPSNEI